MDQNLNEEQIKSGYAWVFKKYCKDTFRSKWLQYAKEARYNELGLWSDKNPIPPWEYIAHAQGYFNEK